MTPDHALALAGFALVTSITPGPNNLMLLASGANFGLRRTAPHALGIGIGHMSMVVLLGAGLVGLFQAWPASHVVLKSASLAYMLYLAWKIATAASPDGARSGARPMTFLQAAAFQWVNPKAWAMALTAVTAYAPDRSLGTVVAVALIFWAVNLPSVSLWAVMGREMRRFLTGPGRLRAFNWTMAVLLVATLVPVLLA